MAQGRNVVTRPKDLSDLKTVITGNAASNDPMLAINKKMGFKEHRAGNEYQISLEKLRAGRAGD